MRHRNAGYVVTMVAFIALLQSACATVPEPATPREDPAEIVLPPPNSFGNAARIRLDLVRFKRGVEHTRTRPAECAGCLVEVQIKSVGKTTDIVPSEGPRRFRIVGWIRNTDRTDIESVYKLKPQTDYLMWVDKGPLNKEGDSQTIWGLQELPLATGAPPPDTIGWVRRCPTAHPVRSNVSDTDFKSCEYSHAPVPAVAQTTLFSQARFEGGASLPARNLYVSPRGWFDCGGYCCSGGQELQR